MNKKGDFLPAIGGR